MAYQLRPPRLTGNDRQQIEQLKSYIFQLTNELEFILNDLSGKIDSVNNTESEDK